MKPTVEAIIGYDCRANQLNLAALSLLEVGECDIPKSKVYAERAYIQILQISDFTLTQVRQCKIEI